MVTAELMVLGSSAAVPMRGRSLPCIVFSYRGQHVLFDAGEGCQHRLIEAGIGVQRVKAVLITHLHGDHFYGLPGLIHSMSMLGRRDELLVVGPKGIREALELLVELGGAKPSFPVRVVEARHGLSLTIPGIGFTARAFQVDHTVEAYGYVLEEPRERVLRVSVEKLAELGLRPGPFLSRLKRGEEVVVEGKRVRPEDVLEEARKPLKIVYTGDTRPCEEVVKAAARATVLIHDSTFHSRDSDRAYEEGHSTSADAGRAAAEASASLLILTHISARYDDVTPLIRDAERFHPYVLAAEEWLKIPLLP